MMIHPSPASPLYRSSDDGPEPDKVLSGEWAEIKRQAAGAGVSAHENRFRRLGVVLFQARVPLMDDRKGIEGRGFIQSDHDFTITGPGNSLVFDEV